MTIDGLERFPSARDIEKVARNPECDTLRTALAANVDLRKYAIALGLEDERQSPLAIARGEQVERQILGKGAARLVEKLVEDGMVQPDPVVEDLGRRQKSRAGMRRSAEKTEAHLEALWQGQAAPDLLVHPVLRVALGENEQFIEPDGLVLFTGRAMYQPLELKSYAYREGRTDPEDLRQARRQGAVYVHALRLRLAELGGDSSLIPPVVTLVFTRPTSLFPAPVYDESVLGEIRDVLHALRLLGDAREMLPTLVPDGIDIADVLPTLDVHYMEQCLSFCALAKGCRERVGADGAAAILGERSARVLGEVTLPRALELIEGAQPDAGAESILAGRLEELSNVLGPFPEAI